jgi:hypothetical protein
MGFFQELRERLFDVENAPAFFLDGLLPQSVGISGNLTASRAIVFNF